MFFIAYFLQQNMKDLLGFFYVNFMSQLESAFKRT